MDIENFQIVFSHLQALFICILWKINIDHSLVSIVNHQIVGFSEKQRSVVNRVLTWMKPTMARERRALSKSILEKRNGWKSNYQDYS